MPGIYDTQLFNERLFFPRRENSSCPQGAFDDDIPVPGAHLHLRWHRSVDSRHTVLLFHGNGEVVADYDRVAAQFAGIRADLAVVDYRGYGRSTGQPTLRNLMEDAHIVVQAVAAKSHLPLVVTGRSLGSAAANEIFGSSSDRLVAAFVIESGFSDLGQLLQRRALPPHPALSVDEVLVFDPLPKLRRGCRPVLFLHGGADTLIRPSEAETAYSACSSETKTLVVIPGFGHNNVSFSEQYWQTLQRHLSSIAV